MANHHNTIFSLDRKDFVLVKPSKPTSSCVLSLSIIDNNPNLQLLSHIVYAYRSNVDSSNDNNHDFTSSCCRQVDPASVIREALSKALVYYYPLAGKLKKNSAGKLQINCTGDGIRRINFKLQAASCNLSRTSIKNQLLVLYKRLVVLFF